MSKLKQLSFIIFTFGFLLFVCGCEREWGNPFDDKSAIDPESWAPQNLQIEDVTITEKKLTWSFSETTNFEGFKIDRKIGDEPWQVDYQVFGKEARSWNDSDIIPDPNLNYQYRLYAYAGKNNSAQKNASTAVSFAPPTDLTISRNTITSVTLNWQKNSTGEEGFKIERKYDTGDWIEAATTTNTSWQDNDFELNTMVFYRVNAYYNQYSSVWLENSFDATIPPPENLTITANSATSVTLNWSYSVTSHEGFKIERNIDNTGWVVLPDFIKPDQRNYIDNEVDLQNYSYSYRLFSFIGHYVSQNIQFPEIPFSCGIHKITDSRDANQYATIKVGNQCWMKENLKWLPNVNPSANGSNTSPFYYVFGYQGTSVSAAKVSANYNTYGVLYNWPATFNACPQGWHLPSDEEWLVLINYLGGESEAGGKMKTTGTTFWFIPNTGATNSSGFSGLPGGFRDSYGGFVSLRSHCCWYSSSDAWGCFLHYDNSNVFNGYYTKDQGFSIRCLKD